MLALPDRLGPAVHLVRHGQSTWNVRRLLQGQNDSAELTDDGRAQADQVARLLQHQHPVRLLTSDLRRAVQTAEILGRAVGLDPIPTALLREQSYGALEGLTTDSATTEWEQLSTGSDAFGDPLPLADVRPAGGESMRMVAARVQALLALPWITDATGDVVLVTHGDTMRVLLAHLLGDDPDHPGWREIGHADVHSVYRDTGGRVRYVRTGPDP